MSNLHIKKGDAVVILAGKDKGKSGQITTVDHDSNRVIIDGLNEVAKHVKPRGAQQKGGIIKMSASIDVSNVQIICSACGKATRVAHKIELVEGKSVKSRVCKKCGASLEVKASAKKATAKKATKTATKTASKKTATKKADQDAKA